MFSNFFVLKGCSDVYIQVDNFLYVYVWGGDELVNGYLFYIVDQVVEQIFCEQVFWQKVLGDLVLILFYLFLIKLNDFFNMLWKYVSDIYLLGKFSVFFVQQQVQVKLLL